MATFPDAAPMMKELDRYWSGALITLTFRVASPETLLKLEVMHKESPAYESIQFVSKVSHQALITYGMCSPNSIHSLK